MQTHLLIMIVLLVCLVEAAMAGYVPNLVLLNEQYRPPAIVMSGENKHIKYAYDRINVKMHIEEYTNVLSFCKGLAGFPNCPV